MSELGTSGLDSLCEECGAPIRDHIIGGPAPYHPRPTRPKFGKSLSDYSDAELRNELHRRAMLFLGDQTIGVTFPTT